MALSDAGPAAEQFRPMLLERVSNEVRGTRQAPSQLEPLHRPAREPRATPGRCNRQLTSAPDVVACGHRKPHVSPRARPSPPSQLVFPLESGKIAEPPLNGSLYHASQCSAPGGRGAKSARYAVHASPAPTKLYDRTAGTVTVNEIERNVI